MVERSIGGVTTYYDDDRANIVAEEKVEAGEVSPYGLTIFAPNVRRRRYIMARTAHP